MRKLIENLRNPNFKNKHYLLLFLPLCLLPMRTRLSIAKWARDNWEKNPALMHRLSWTVTPW